MGWQCISGLGILALILKRAMPVLRTKVDCQGDPQACPLIGAGALLSPKIIIEAGDSLCLQWLSTRKLISFWVPTVAVSIYTTVNTVCFCSSHLAKLKMELCLLFFMSNSQCVGKYGCSVDNGNKNSTDRAKV